MISKSVHRYNNLDKNNQSIQSNHLKREKQNAANKVLSKSHEHQQFKNKNKHSYSVQIPRKIWNQDIFVYKRPLQFKRTYRKQTEQHKSYEDKNNMTKFRQNLDKIKYRLATDQTSNIINTNRYQRFVTQHSIKTKQSNLKLNKFKSNKKTNAEYRPIQVFLLQKAQQDQQKKQKDNQQLSICRNQIPVKKKFSLPANLLKQKSQNPNLTIKQLIPHQNNCISAKQMAFIKQKVKQIQSLRLVNLYSTDYLKQSNLILKSHIFKTIYPNRNKIINIPDQSNMHRFLELYEPIIKDINIRLLKLSPKFQIKQFTDQQIKRVYFGEIIDEKFNGRGILISAYDIMQGTWKDGFLISGIFKNEFQIYEGQFKNNKKNGFGQSNYKDGSYFHGHWIQNLRHGEGYLTSHCGLSYFGNWIQGNITGWGILKTLRSVYEGEFLQSMRFGFGQQKFLNGDSYEGNFAYDLPSKYGEYLWKQGSRYIGEFNQGKRSGKGKLTNPSGLMFSGNFKNDQLHGNGEIYFSNGDEYKGQFQQGKLRGFGNLTNKIQRKIFAGFWFNNKLSDFEEI